MNKYTLVIIISIFIYISGCNRDELLINNPPPINSDKGLYLLCEGTFTLGSSKLSYYDLVSDSFYVNIFSPGNIGLYPDGITLHNNQLYITEQGNYNSIGQIIKADTNGIKISSSPAGINPYSLAVANNKIYATNGLSGSITVIEPVSLAILKSIKVGVFPQEILAVNNKIFVCNTGIFNGSNDSTVSVIDAITDSVVHIIDLQRDPSGIALWKNNKLLVGCQGPAGLIYVIDLNSYSVLDSAINTWGFSRDICTDNLSSEIYFISNANHVVRMNMDNKNFGMFIENTNLNSNFYYGYYFDNERRKHYLADAKNFSVNGSLSVYDVNGNLEKSFETGISPRRFLKK